MSDKIFCEYYKRDLDQMERPPYPGSLGERIHLNISKEAWEERIKHTEAETIRAMNWFNKTFG